VGIYFIRFLFWFLAHSIRWHSVKISRTFFQESRVDLTPLYLVMDGEVSPLYRDSLYMIIGSSIYFCDFPIRAKRRLDPSSFFLFRKLEARSILCYRATDSLGISRRESAKRLKLTQPAVSQAVRRGKDLVKSQSYYLFHD